MGRQDEGRGAEQPAVDGPGRRHRAAGVDQAAQDLGVEGHPFLPATPYVLEEGGDRAHLGHLLDLGDDHARPQGRSDRHSSRLGGDIEGRSGHLARVVRD